MSRTVVVGGGLSGLAAAHRLLERDPDAEVTVLEAADRAGGILGTVERDGFVIETGPDSILSEKTAAIELAERLGIADRLVRTRGAHRGAYVVSHGRLVRVPEGFSLMAPTRWAAWATTPIMSWPGKLRAALETVIPRHRGPEESMARFVRRRFGREVLDRLAQPLVGGIYGGDPDRLSLEATMPRFVSLERDHGSVIRGMRARQRRRAEQAASGARYGLFVAFDRGMQVLIDALVARLGGRVKVGAKVTGLARRHGGWRAGFEGGGVDADRVILALPAWRAAALVAPHHERLTEALESIPYGSAATVTSAWPRADVPHPMDAFGFVVPSVERRSVLAATFSSVKWPDRAPEGEVLVRVFVGGANAPDVAELDDPTLVALARRELRSLMGVEAAPRFSLVWRYTRAMPQYQVGHLARVDAIEAMQRDLPGLDLAGNAYRGVGIPDTIRYAEAVADRAPPPSATARVART
ncbi:MAG TPA: protoporphyrinogen oxidase [Sandaracinaceae bacterium LLY-WYZ-13_1]|nr:protoporphyrinogen oxidase [Sandaracinaceae bacterium LLY-WYZ-13_1]